VCCVCVCVCKIGGHVNYPRGYSIDPVSVLSSAGSVCSVESFPVLSRASSRNLERDWESGSIASSITSTEYNGERNSGEICLFFRLT